MRNLKNSLLIVIMGITLVSCENENPIHIEGFNNEIWKSDSLGCNLERESMLGVLLKNKYEILGHTEKEALDFLGYANFVDGTDKTKYMHYYIDKGPQCYRKNISENELVNNSFFTIRLTNNRVDEITASIP